MVEEYKITLTYHASAKKTDAVYDGVADWGWGEVDDHITMYMNKKKVPKGVLETTQIVFINESIQAVKIEKTTVHDKESKARVVRIREEPESD